MSIQQFIDNEVKSNDVVLFMKGTPQFPMCGFSGQVVQILDYLGVPYKGLNVLENEELRNGRSEWLPAADGEKGDKSHFIMEAKFCTLYGDE